LNAVASLKPKAPAIISVQRGDKALALTVTVAQRPKSQIAAQQRQREQQREQ
jgi:serine protease DegQ